jgi:hypothetical protein
MIVGTYLSWLFVTGLIVAGCFFIAVILWHNLRIWRVRRAYRDLPREIEDRVLTMIEEAAMGRPSVTFLRLGVGRRCDGLDASVQSHVGGLPYMEPGEAWPTERPAKFLVQVRLDEPSLGRAWHGRLLTVFLVSDGGQIVRSYASPSLDRSVAVPGPASPLPCIPLTPLRFPVEGEESRVPASPAGLCDLVPAIPQLLGEFTGDIVGLLSQILRPGVYGYDLAEHDIAYAGGEPMLIQNPHEPMCEDCGEPMRFLFQFGVVIPGLHLADGGICYIYGCDEHPHRCEGFLDSH